MDIDWDSPLPRPLPPPRTLSWSCQWWEPCSRPPQRSAAPPRPSQWSVLGSHFSRECFSPPPLRSPSSPPLHSPSSPPPALLPPLYLRWLQHLFRLSPPSSNPPTFSRLSLLLRLLLLLSSPSSSGVCCLIITKEKLDTNKTKYLEEEIPAVMRWAGVTSVSSKSFPWVKAKWRIIVILSLLGFSHSGQGKGFACTFFLNFCPIFFLIKLLSYLVDPTCGMRGSNIL